MKSKQKPRRTTKAKTPRPIGKYLIKHPGVCHGEITFQGTRVPFESIMVALAQGRSIDTIRESWPEVKPEAIVEAISLASAAFLKRYDKSRRRRP